MGERGKDKKRKKKKMMYDRPRRERAARRDGARVQTYIYNVKVGNDAGWLGEDETAKNEGSRVSRRNGEKKKVRRKMKWPREK